MPSELHNTLANMALRWLGNRATGRGVRGGFEVPVGDGYVADAVALCTFQWQFAKRYGLSERQSNTLVLIPEVACIFESKTTRPDFLATFGDGKRHENRKQPIGHVHWCVIGRGIAKPEELPDFWGLLEVRGTGLTERKQPTPCYQSEATLHAIAYQILWYAKNSHEPSSAAVYQRLDY